MTNTYTLKAKESGERIDALLARSIDGLTRSQAAKLLESGAVTLCSTAVKKNYKVREGEVFLVEIPIKTDAKPLPENIPLDVIYEDDDLLVVNKPRGMVVHPSPGHDSGTLVNALLYHCGDKLSTIGGEERPGIVHRIDKDTSGLIIAAKNNYAHRFLSSQLADHSLARIYEAVVIGRIREGTGTVNAPIGRHPIDRKRMAVKENGSDAITHYEVIAHYNGYTHIRCRLETGRTHQIRVHMAKIGHPVLGDLVYGRRHAEKGLQGQCLHARSLTFNHPKTNKAVKLTTDLPDYFKKVLSRLGPEIG